MGNPTTTVSTFTSITALASSSTASLCTTAAAATPAAASTTSTSTATASSITSLFPTLLAPPTRVMLIGWQGKSSIGLSGGVRHAVCAMGTGAAASRHHSHVAAYLGRHSVAPATSLDTHAVLAVALMVSWRP